MTHQLLTILLDRPPNPNIYRCSCGYWSHRMDKLQVHLMLHADDPPDVLPLMEPVDLAAGTIGDPRR